MDTLSAVRPESPLAPSIPGESTGIERHRQTVVVVVIVVFSVVVIRADIIAPAAEAAVAGVVANVIFRSAMNPAVPVLGIENAKVLPCLFVVVNRAQPRKALRPLMSFAI
ncbi:hypothetical protein [Pseudovibrio exalbescens]|uniref:hypothetical protein n=1 Tax=Pseudovibrio exalbescens TaxID=197461 RepID=UPI0011AFA84D|nr:hypothetical protein [Pseudovibrio exalbescens]